MTISARIAGVGGYVPPRIVTNHQLSERLDTSDEWIRSRTGIGARHVIDSGTSTSDLAIIAGRRALDNAGTPTDVDLLVLATTTPDHPCPATAPVVADALGLGPIAAYDIAAVCSGFVYALSSATAVIRAGLARRVLVIGAETFTTLLDPTDRSTQPIFGDGAGAVVLEPARSGVDGELLQFNLGSDGSQSDLIRVPGGGSKERSDSDPQVPFSPYFHMQGPQVFRAAVTRMTESSRRVLEQTGWQVDDIEWFVGHQANARIITAIGEQLGVDAARAIMNLEHVGNTSAASIPLALVDAAAQNRMASGDRVLLTAFGGGTTWGSVTLTWPQLAAVKPITEIGNTDIARSA